MLIGFILLVVMAVIGSNSRSVNVNRTIFVLGLVVCGFGTIGLGKGSWIVFVIYAVIWLIIYGGVVMGKQKSKAINYLANKDDESKRK